MNIEQLINFNKIRTRDIKSRRELWKDKIYYLESNPYWDKNTYKLLPMPSTFHRIQQELKKVVAKQQTEIKNPNCHILEHTSEHLVFVFFPDPPIFENLKDFLWTTGNNVWYETEKWERTRLHVVVYTKKEIILSYYMKWLCSAWQGVVHNSPLLTITSADFNATDYDEICMCPSILDASETVEFACLPTEPKEEFFEYNLCGEIWLDQNQFKEKCKNQGDRIALTDANDQRVKAQMAVTTANFMIDSFKEFIEGMEVGENVKFLGFKLTVNPIRARGCRFYLGVKSPEQVVEEKNGTYDKDKYFEIGRGNSWDRTISFFKFGNPRSPDWMPTSSSQNLLDFLTSKDIYGPQAKYAHFLRHINVQFFWQDRPISHVYSLKDLEPAFIRLYAKSNPAGITYRIKSGRIDFTWEENCSSYLSPDEIYKADANLMGGLVSGGVSSGIALLTGRASLAISMLSKSVLGGEANHTKRVISSIIDGSRAGGNPENNWQFALNWKEPKLKIRIEFNNQRFNQFRRERDFKINGNKWETTDAVAKLVNHPGYYKLVTFTSEWDTLDKFFTNLFSEGVNLYKENPRERFDLVLAPFLEAENIIGNSANNQRITIVNFSDSKVEGQDEDVEYDERSWILQKSFLKDTVTGKDYLPELVKSRPTSGGEINPKKSILLTKYPEDTWNSDGDYMQAYCNRDIPAHSGGWEGRETQTTYKYYRRSSFYTTSSDSYTVTDYDNVLSSETKTYSGTEDIWTNRKGNYEKSGTRNYSYTREEKTFGRKPRTDTKYHYSTYYEGEGSTPKPNYQVVGWNPERGATSTNSPSTTEGYNYKITKVIREGVYRQRSFAKPAAWKFGAKNQWKSEPIELTKGHQHSCAIYGWSTEGGNGQEKLIFQAEESGDADAWTATLIQNGATWTIEFNKATYITEVKKAVDAWTEKDREAYEEMKREWAKEQEEQQIKPDFFDTTMEQLKPQPDLKLKEQEDKANEEFQEYLRQQEALRAKQQEQLRQRQQEAEAEQKKAREQLASRSRSQRNWKNISSEFTAELQEQWETLGFSYEQTQDWINTGFGVKDAEFVAWLEQNDINQETTLNSLSSEDLSQLHRNFEEERRESQNRRKPKDKEDGEEREN